MSRKRPLTWKRTGAHDGAICFWATQWRPHNLCFNVNVWPPKGRSKPKVELIAWAGPDDTPLVERTIKVNAPLEQILKEIAHYQTLVIANLADALDARANHVAELFAASL